MLCVSPELQTSMDETDIASVAWKILTNKYESPDPSKVSVIRSRYENNYMVKGQTIISYITAMKELRNQLAQMGKLVDESTHAAFILRNVPDSWRTISQTIRMITEDPYEIECRLEAHKADIVANQRPRNHNIAFIAQNRPN